MSLFSDAHAARDLIYSWKNNPGIKILDDTMSQFELTGYSSKSEMVGYVAGKFTDFIFLLKAVFTLVVTRMFWRYLHVSA